jgi:hypothetical protein
MLIAVNIRRKNTSGATTLFCLMETGGTNFEVVVTFPSLLIRKVKISLSVYLAQAGSPPIDSKRCLMGRKFSQGDHFFSKF